jgi:hypothetical protein
MKSPVLCTRFGAVHSTVHSLCTALCTPLCTVLCTQLCTQKGKIVHSTVHSLRRATSFTSSSWLSAQWLFALDLRALAVVSEGTGVAVVVGSAGVSGGGNPRSRKAGGGGGVVGGKSTKPAAIARSRQPLGLSAPNPDWGLHPQTPAEAKSWC